MDNRDLQNLTWRYLLWLYKTTKEAFDRYERKFTQLEIDAALLREMKRQLKGAYMPHEKKALEKYINEFRVYIAEKEKTSLQLKYKGRKTNPEFLFLDVKLSAIEEVIREKFGAEELARIKALYEEEMSRRIMTATEHSHENQSARNGRA